MTAKTGKKTKTTKTVVKKTSETKKKRISPRTVKELPKRDITSFVTKQMLSGNISILKIPRGDLEQALEAYCESNPTIDATNIPLVGICDRNGTDAVAKAAIALAKKHCGRKGSGTAVFSKDGHNAILFGKSAREIVSKVSVDRDAKVDFLKTKIKVRASFPVDRKLKCFGGEKISDHI